MNMRALLLHVLGDALGNVGVIATGLVIWRSSWSFKYYFDPVISLVIAVIIFSSALPLVRSASFILLQGVPPSISLDHVRESILGVDGVLGLHDLHVWTLSESKMCGPSLSLIIHLSFTALLQFMFLLLINTNLCPLPQRFVRPSITMAFIQALFNLNIHAPISTENLLRYFLTFLLAVNSTRML